MFAINNPPAATGGDLDLGHAFREMYRCLRACREIDDGLAGYATAYVLHGPAGEALFNGPDPDGPHDAPAPDPWADAYDAVTDLDAPHALGLQVAHRARAIFDDLWREQLGEVFSYNAFR